MLCRPRGPSAARCGPRAPRTRFVGRNPEVLRLLAKTREVAPTDAPVLITGESGTGKEILAHMIHRLSARATSPYIAVNCGAIADTLEESELFGHMPGAFTGADERKRGRFEVADGGTLFLDEIGETNLRLQVKLLRVLESGEYAPVGSPRNHHCDVRIVAATNQPLGAAVVSKAFRADLFYRLDVVRLRVPPLRDRKDDIPLLARYFASHYGRRYGTPVLRIEPGFFKRLMRYDYPGNVRELSNYIHRAVIAARAGVLTEASLEPIPSADTDRDQSPPPSPGPTRMDASVGVAVHIESFHDAKRRLVEAFEREYLMAVLAECGGIVSRAADRAGLSERGFHQKLRQYGISGMSFRVQK